MNYIYFLSTRRNPRSTFQEDQAKEHILFEEEKDHYKRNHA